MTRASQLYLLSPPQIDLARFVPALEEAFAGGAIAAFQLRLKGAPDDAILAACRALMPIVRAADCAFILNDRADLAAQCGADGVHIGQSDGPLKAARALMGEDRVVGVTCHNSRHLAMQAGEGGADYVAFGAFFPSATKDAPTRAEPDLLTWWQETMEIPCVAIGGIGIAQARAMQAAGADLVAISSGVWAHPDGPRAAIAAYVNELV